VLEMGGRMELVFSTMYGAGLCPGLKGAITGLDGSDITSILWDTGVEQELIDPGVDTYRVMSRSFATEAYGIGRLVMQPVGGDAAPPLPPPKPGRRVEFLFTVIHLGGNLHWGSQGEVICVDGLGIIHVQWDNGATLGLIPDWDHFIVLPAKNEGK